VGKLAEAYVEVDAKTQGFDKGLDDSQKKLSAWAGHASKIVAAFVIAKAGQEFASFLASSAKAASDLAESANKAGVAFGSAFPKIEAFAEGMANKFGIIKSEIYDITAGLGFMLTNAGLTKDKAAELAITLARSAADVSSIQNMPVGTVLEKMRAGISGEAEPLRPLGVNVSAENVEKQARSMGIQTKELTDQEKILARIALIVKGLTYAQGDLEKTIGGYANATRRAAGEWENFKAKFGGPVAGFGADAMAAARQIADDPTGYLKKLFTPDTGDAYQKEADKRAGVGSKEMTAPAPLAPKSKAERDAAIVAGIIAKRNADDYERTVGKPGRNLMADIAQRMEPVKNALGNALSGNVGNILGGLLHGGLAGGIKGAAQGGLLNPIAQRLAPTMGKLDTHVMDAGDFARFAQERSSEGANAQAEAAKEAAKNTGETVAQLKDVVSAIKGLGKGIGGAIMRGAS
jgi:hypothetical protein